MDLSTKSDLPTFDHTNLHIQNESNIPFIDHRYDISTTWKIVSFPIFSLKKKKKQSNFPLTILLAFD